MLVFGTFAHAVTYRILTRARAWFALAVFNTIVVFILMGYLVSVFSARYAFLTAAVTWLLLNLNERLYRTNNSRADRYPAKT
jgi:hypothetical protein